MHTTIRNEDTVCIFVCPSCKRKYEERNKLWLGLGTLFCRDCRCELKRVVEAPVGTLAVWNTHPYSPPKPFLNSVIRHWFERSKKGRTKND